MSDPMQPPQPSEAEIRAYLAQLREADPAAIVAQAWQMLAEAAQIKLGRSDARVLIDTLHAMTEAGEGRLPAELLRQMRDGVRQLQMAQVQAEQEMGAQREDAEATGAPDAGSATASPAGEQPSQGAEPAGGQKMTDRLWIPGRGPARP